MHEKLKATHTHTPPKKKTNVKRVQDKEEKKKNGSIGKNKYILRHFCTQVIQASRDRIDVKVIIIKLLVGQQLSTHRHLPIKNDRRL